MTLRPLSRIGTTVAVVVGGLLLFVVFNQSAGGAEASSGSVAPALGTADDDGAELYQTSCSSCHGVDGTGTDRGPTLMDEGAAGIDWTLRTGRMPHFAVKRQAIPRTEKRFDAAEISAITTYLQSLGMEGPEVPKVDADAGDVAQGGAIFREYCAACHQVLAQGGAVNDGRVAPTLQDVSQTTVGEALLVGPGVMPDFSNFTTDEVNDLAAFVTRGAQQPDDAGGFGIGHLGPVPEGFVTWVVLLIPIIVLLHFIGTRARS